MSPLRGARDKAQSRRHPARKGRRIASAFKYLAAGAAGMVPDIGPVQSPRSAIRAEMFQDTTAWPRWPKP